MIENDATLTSHPVLESVYQNNATGYRDTCRAGVAHEASAPKSISLVRNLKNPDAVIAALEYGPVLTHIQGRSQYFLNYTSGILNN